MRKYWAYIAGSGIITLWTVVKFVITPTVFDLVGQQVVAGQMLAGQGSGAVLGTTNYLWKMVTMYMPLHVLPGSPRLKLLLLTCVVNIATFVLIGVLVQKIARALGARPTAWFNVALLWLACLAGSVFWIQFTNSRNLEVVGGLFLVLLGLKFIRKPSWKFAVLLALYASLVFFADTLQFYMTALPLLVYAGIAAGRQARQQWRSLASLAAVFLVGLVGAKVWFAATAHVFDITYLQAQSSLMFNPLPLFVPTAKAYAHLLLGGTTGGRLREVANALAFVGFAAVAIRAYVQHKLPKRIGLYVATVLIVNTAVFMVSNFVSQGGTERYLIMTMPAFMVAISVLPFPQKPNRRKFVQVAVGFFVGINVILLAHVLLQNWPQRFQADNHTMQGVQYTREHPEEVTLSSMDAAIPGAYLSGNYKYAPLPLSCEVNGIRESYLFYAREAYEARLKNQRQAAIILDGEVIMNAPNVCTPQAIEQQFTTLWGGGFTHATTLPDGSLVLHFKR